MQTLYKGCFWKMLVFQSAEAFILVLIQPMIVAHVQLLSHH